VLRPPTFTAGEVVEIPPGAGRKGDQSVLMQVESCQPASTSGWGYLRGYLPGQGWLSTLFVDLNKVFRTEIH
jgi:hypothetical protein